MNIIVNGEKKEVVKGTTITKLLEHMSVDKNYVVAELNGGIVGAEKFDITTLNEGDKLEIVRFVGGG